MAASQNPTNPLKSRDQGLERAARRLKFWAVLTVSGLMVILLLMGLWGWQDARMALGLSRLLTHRFYLYGSPSTPKSISVPYINLIEPKEDQEALSTLYPKIPTPPQPTPEATDSGTSAAFSLPPPTGYTIIQSAWELYIIMTLVIGVIVLLPWMLLLAFALLKADRVSRLLLRDLQKLGIEIGSERIEDIQVIIREELRRISPAEKPKWYMWKGAPPAGGDDPQTSQVSMPELMKAYYQIDKDDEIDLVKLDQMVGQLMKPVREIIAGMPVDMATRGLEEDWEKGKISDVQYNALMKIWYELIQLITQQRNDILLQKIRRRFKFSEYFLPLLLLTIFLSINLVWLFFPSGIYGFIQTVLLSSSLDVYVQQVIFAGLSAATAAVLVAYTYMLYQFIRRYNRDDITPNAYWEMLKRVLGAFLLTFVFTAFIASINADQARAWGLAFAILAGFFFVDAMQYLIKLAQVLLVALFAKFASAQGQTSSYVLNVADRLKEKHPLYLLDDLDQWDSDRLQEEGVIGLQGMATCNMEYLLIWTPFPTRQIVDWVDQSILHMAAGAEVEQSFIAAFRKVGLRTASSLLFAVQDGVSRVVSAVQTSQIELLADRLPPAQVAALRAELALKGAEQSVCALNSLQAGDPLDSDTEKSVQAALELARQAGDLAVTAHHLVRDGGSRSAAALEQANNLNGRAALILRGTDSLGAALSAAAGQVTDELVKALQDTCQVYQQDPGAAALAAELAARLDLVAEPLAGAEKTAEALLAKCQALRGTAESPQTTLPSQAGDLEARRSDLLQQLQAGRELIQANPQLTDITSRLDELIKKLAAAGPDSLAEGIQTLQDSALWTSSSSDGKSSAFPAAKKLEGLARENRDMIREIAASSKAKAQLAARPADMLLTEDVLHTIMAGLELNGNLRRILRYKTLDASETLPPHAKYSRNREWIMPSQRSTTQN